MLKLQLNRNEFGNDLVPIDYTDLVCEEYGAPDSNDEYIGDAHRSNILTCYHDNQIKVNVGDNVSFTYTAIDSYGYDMSIVKRYTVNGVEDNSFTCLVDRYLELNADVLSFVKVSDYIVGTDDEYSDRYYIYLYIDGFSYFNAEDNGTGTVYLIDGNGDEIKLVAEPLDDNCIRFPLDEEPLNDCENGDEFCEGLNEDISKRNLLIGNNKIAAMNFGMYFNLIDGNAENFDDAKPFLFNESESYQYTAKPFRFLAYNFMFDSPISDGKLTVNLVRPNISLSIPLFSNSATDLYQESNIREKFVDVEVKKAINKRIEYEKDVYTPVYLDNETYKDVTEIHFNLHFRQRSEDGWKVLRGGYWNGVKGVGSDPSLMNLSNNADYGYFSYKNDKSSQSDLLTYIGFSDADVKYRKNTLKKSFLRLSFFDSTQPTKQNLLCYSTVFVDTGALFSKYMRNFDTPQDNTDYFAYSRLMLNSDAEQNTRLNLVGSRVNREPYWTNGDDYPDNDIVETFRLSSQFVVKDKYSSDSCSEGFYLYLWKDNENGNVPTDIYMRVEFNHAGFGRTIPFMLPYDKSSKGIKEFNTIISDFDDGGGYGIKEYLRYSYIHFKYLTTNDGKHIYYLDYNNVKFNNGVLTINLYEAKLIDLQDEGD